MLDSMINNPRPTRAEVTDVANAIFDGTDAIMLSGETAIGKYPVKATRMMANVALATEAGLDYTERLKREQIEEEKSIPSAIAHAACHIVLAIRAKVIICCTQSEQDARLLAKYRPSASIVVSSWSETTLQRALLSWGTFPTLIEWGPQILSSQLKMRRLLFLTPGLQNAEIAQSSSPGCRQGLQHHQMRST